MQPHRPGRAEPGPLRDVVDGQVALLQQGARAFDALPREPLTLPKRVLVKIVGAVPRCASAADMSFSAISFETPIVDVGFTALSELENITPTS